MALFVGFEFGNVGFRLRGHNEDFRAFVLHGFAYPLHIFVADGGTRLIDVAHVEHGLRGEEEEVAQRRLLVFGVKVHAAGIFAFKQGGSYGGEHVIFYLCVLVVADLGNFLHALDAVFHRFQIFELQLGVDDFFVSNGVYAAVHVHHVAVVEAAQHV